jgi:hypothetical protein
MADNREPDWVDRWFPMPEDVRMTGCLVRVIAAIITAIIFIFSVRWL